MFTATIHAEGDPDSMYDCIKSEEMKYDRSSFDIEKTDNGLKFNIKAKDPTAMRASLNSICQILTIYHQLKELQNE